MKYPLIVFALLFLLAGCESPHREGITAGNAIQYSPESISTQELADRVTAAQTSKERIALLYCAVYLNDLASARELMKAKPTFCGTGHEENPLVVAASLGRAEIVQLFLNSGVSADLPGQGNQTALMYAAEGPSGEVLSFHRTGRHSRDFDRRNKVFLATMKILLESGADPSCRNDLGETAESFASVAGNQEALKLLKTWKGRRTGN